jgi:hypothetical protein
MGFCLMDSSSGATIATPQWDWGETNRVQSTPCYPLHHLLNRATPFTLSPASLAHHVFLRNSLLPLYRDTVPQ